LHPVNKDLSYDETVIKLVFCSVNKILLVLCENSSFVRVYDTNYTKILDYYILIKGKKNLDKLSDFDFDSETRTVS
jgi:hypothetical protein